MLLKVIAAIAVVPIFPWIMAPKLPGAVAGGCTGTVSEGAPAPGPRSSLACEDHCTGSRGCQSRIVTTSVGQGAVCTCAGQSWDDCCTIALVPPSATGLAFPAGECGVKGCPGAGTCVGVEIEGTGDLVAECQP